MTGSLMISVDAMSGDVGPDPVIAGMARALADNDALRFLVFGDSAVLAKKLRRRRYSALRAAVEIRHADDVVSMSDVPSRALRERRGSSMWASLEAVKAGDAPVAISCGNTGALLAMSVLILRKAPGIDRPAIAVHWPANSAAGFNTVLDVGADLRAGPRTLMQYAIMGAEYARLSFGIDRPRIGFLNIGTEATKGHADLRDAAAKAEEVAQHPAAPFASVGFVEGSDICGDAADVIVTDGFTGNIALKTAEGTAAFIRAGLKDAFAHSFWSKIGTLFALTSLRRFRKRIDPRRVNGGVFLGLNGTVVKSHGDADAVGVAAALRLAATLAANDLGAAVNQQLDRIDLSALPHQSTPRTAEGGTNERGTPAPVAGSEPDDGSTIRAVAEDSRR
ncbi:MAG: phosphate acyltransferase PlsX [Pseudomonadota bacterium]